MKGEIKCTVYGCEFRIENIDWPENVDGTPSPNTCPITFHGVQKIPIPKWLKDIREHHRITGEKEKGKIVDHQYIPGSGHGYGQLKLNNGEVHEVVYASRDVFI